MGGRETNGNNIFYIIYRDHLKLLEKNYDSPLLKQVWIIFLTIVIFCGILIISARDIKIIVYLESLRKINFNLVSEFLSK